jgi:cystathionine beta-lyase
MSYVMTDAAYRHGERWLSQLIAYLAKNRSFVEEFVCDQLPGVRVAPIEGTYLAWLDCRDLGLEESARTFFLREARVGLNDGGRFGPGGEGFARLNFATPRSNLLDGLQRMRRALLLREENT